MQTYEWRFPLPRTHTGMLLGNGTVGAMIWGEGNVLRVTLNRAEFWDHRGGKPWTAEMNWGNIRHLLETGDEDGLRAAFEGTPPPPGEPRRPSVLPLGRLELHFPEGYRLTTGTLHLEDGYVVVRVADADGYEHAVTLDLAMESPVLHAELPVGVPIQVVRVPAWEYVGEYLASISFEPPVMVDEEGVAGWVQSRPVDPPLCLGYQQAGRSLWVALEYGDDVASAIAAVQTYLEAADIDVLRRENARWWAQYWAQVPEIEIPNERLAFIYYYGMYKFAGLTNPTGVAATLQGPWVEEYQMPPWSSDYHFNINVQECYWPAYQGNLLHHLRPMFDMVWSWREKLRDNARLFLGIDDGYMLPHAVDDRGTCMGGFWTGTVDHGCTAWVALMMADYWRYTGDVAFLREVAYPFMAGAMRVYEGMLDREGDGFVLPVSVSPEYRGSAMNAWGRNASFQLAAIHALLEALQQAAAALGETPQPIWAEVQAGLPTVCVEAPDGKARIMLWQGTDLEESHRHHSHWGALYPFDVIEPTDPAWREVVLNTYNHWRWQGMGRWTGWCMPWAAMLEARAGSPEVAELLMEYWQRMYTNEGHGTLHDPRVFKRNLADQTPTNDPIPRGFGHGKEIMQIEAGMAATAAVMDFLVHVRRGVHYLFQGAPPTWREARFTGIRTQGGFLVSGERREGETAEVRVLSEVGGMFRLANPWGGVEVTVDGDMRGMQCGSVIALDLPAGVEVRLRKAVDIPVGH